MIPSHHLWIALGGLLLVAPIGSAAEPEARPVNVSPGSPVGTLISERCPTFSWGGLEGTESYELVVYGLLQGLAAAEPEKLEKRLQVTLPGAAHGWTPSLDRCFEPGGRYAWVLRAVTDEGVSEWSEASLFEVSAVPSVAQVEEAVRVLRRYLQRESEELPETEEAPLAGAVDPRSVPASGRAERRLGESLGALSSGTVGAGPPSKAVTPPASYSLKIDGAFALGGFVFKEGKPFLHNDGGYGAGNTALGLDALISTTLGTPNSSSGHYNTAQGQQALRSNDSGAYNTASGFQALFANTAGSRNTADGHAALTSNDSGECNTASGSRALLNNLTGSANTAVGEGALLGLESSGTAGGSRNIAVGRGAGGNLREGDDNIYLGTQDGPTVESGKIRIGNSSHTATYIAGQVALGTNSTANQLVVRENINGNGGTTTDHVVLIENTSTLTSPDVLALKVREEDPTTTVNFITFFDASGGIGAIEGNGGGVTLNTSSADFAEYLPKLDEAESLAAGDVVGLFGGRLSRRTEGAERVLVVTTHPIVVGGNPGPSRVAAYEQVAFLGQAPVRVRGPVREGDYVVASGRQDGTAVAVAAKDLGRDQAPLLVGRALESSSERGESTVRTLVGLPETATLAAWDGDLASEVRRLQAQIESQQEMLSRLGARLARLDGRR